MSINPTETLAAIVARHPASARVFQAHRLDFCCHGDVTLEAALRGRPESAAAVLREVEAAIESLDRDVATEDVAALPVAALVSRIIERHHAFLRRQLPAIEPLLLKVARVHGEHNPKLAEVAEAFLALRAALEPHLDEEEQVLFPLLMTRAPDAEKATAGLGRMFEDHLAVGRLIGHLREQTDDYATPAWGCRSYRLLMSELEDLETDLLRHVHLENHVLMPRFTPRGVPPRSVGQSPPEPSPLPRADSRAGAASPRFTPRGVPPRSVGQSPPESSPLPRAASPRFKPST